jgi:hypothetical protein
MATRHKIGYQHEKISDFFHAHLVPIQVQAFCESLSGERPGFFLMTEKNLNILQLNHIPSRSGS